VERGRESFRPSASIVIRFRQSASLAAARVNDFACFLVGLCALWFTERAPVNVDRVNASTQKVNESEKFSDRLKRWRVRLDLNQPKAAKLLGIGRTYYSEIENGREPGKFLRQKFDLIEHESVGFVNNALEEKSSIVREEARISRGIRSAPGIYDAERELKVRRLPLIGWAQAGQAVDFEDVVDWDQVVTVEIDDPKAIAIRIRGDSMAPRFVEGDIAILAVSDPPRNEDLVIARLRDEGVVFKKLQIVDAAAGQYRLISFNDKYASMDRTADQFAFIYPVDSVIQKLRRK
jgi:phage repressor protein C with HTH and peptisase S24 domain